MGKLEMTLQTDKNSPITIHMKEPESTQDREIKTLKRKFHKLFTENHRKKNVEVGIQLKEGGYRKSNKVD